MQGDVGRMNGMARVKPSRMAGHPCPETRISTSLTLRST